MAVMKHRNLCYELSAYLKKMSNFLKSLISVVYASQNCLRNVRKSLDVGMIATVLRMPSSACLVLRAMRRVKRRAKNSKSAAYVNVTTQRDHVCS